MADSILTASDFAEPELYNPNSTAVTAVVGAGVFADGGSAAPLDLSAAFVEDGSLGETFALPPTWSTTDNLNVTLSDDNSTVALPIWTGGTFTGAGARGTTSHTTGKFYMEFSLRGVIGGGESAGGPIATPFPGCHVGVAPASYSFDPSTPGQNGPLPIGSDGTKDIFIRMKADLDAHKVWYKILFGGVWFDWIGETLPTGALYPFVNFTSSALHIQSATANFGTTPFTYDVPDGFSSWDSGTAGVSPDVGPPGTQIVTASSVGTDPTQIARSTDGDTFTLSGAQPVHDNGDSIAWDSAAYSPALHRWVVMTHSPPDLARQIITSDDEGATWDQRTSPELNQWRSVVWATDLGIFVAVADSGTHRVMTSPDGIAWTVRTAASADEWFSVTWAAALGLLVAVAKTGTGTGVMTSPDGVNWTTRTPAADHAWNTVVWAEALGLLLAVANTVAGSDNVMTSPDGSTWTSVNTTASGNLVGACWSSYLGRFLVVADTGGGIVGVSDDGASFTFNSPTGSHSFQGCAWSNTAREFIIVADDTILASPDGSSGSWTSKTSPAARGWVRVAEGLLSEYDLSNAFAEDGTFVATPTILFPLHPTAAFVEDGTTVARVSAKPPLNVTAAFDEGGFFEADPSIHRPPPPVQAIVVVVGR
jgi:hypothetical protein